MLTVFPCSGLLVIDEVHQCAEYVDGSHDCSELSVHVANISKASGLSHLAIQWPVVVSAPVAVPAARVGAGARVRAEVANEAT